MVEKEVAVVVVKEPETITLMEPVAAPVVPAKPTKEELVKQGWGPEEIERAEKQGLVGKVEEPKPKEEPQKEVIPEAKEKPKPEEKPKGPVSQSLPEFNLTEEQEQKFGEFFGTGSAPRGLYFRLKNERRQRQALEVKAHELEVQLKTIQEANPPEENAEDDDKPLTLRQLKELQQKEADRIEEQRQSQQGRSVAVKQAHLEQEEFVRNMHADFDIAVAQAKDLLQNLETLLPEKWKQAKAIKLVRELQVAAANADKLGVDEYNAAHIAYELGQLHPKYGEEPKDGKTKEENPPKDPKANGGLTADQMKRIEKNTQRRAPSAAIPAGGGSRTVSVEDVDLATLNKMSANERLAFRQKYPDRWEKLMRG